MSILSQLGSPRKKKVSRTPSSSDVREANTVRELYEASLRPVNILELLRAVDQHQEQPFFGHVYFGEDAPDAQARLSPAGKAKPRSRGTARTIRSARHLGIKMTADTMDHGKSLSESSTLKAPKNASMGSRPSERSVVESVSEKSRVGAPSVAGHSVRPTEVTAQYHPPSRPPLTLKEHKNVCERRRQAVEQKSILGPDEVEQLRHSAATRSRGTLWQAKKKDKIPVKTPQTERTKKPTYLKRANYKAYPQSFADFIARCEHDFPSRSRAWYVLSGNRIEHSVNADEFDARVENLMNLPGWAKSRGRQKVRESLQKKKNDARYYFDLFDPASAKLVEQLIRTIRESFGTTDAFWNQVFSPNSVKQSQHMVALSKFQSAVAHHLYLRGHNLAVLTQLCTAHDPVAKMISIREFKWLDFWKRKEILRKKANLFVRIEATERREVFHKILKKYEVPFVQSWMRYIKTKMAAACAPISLARLPYTSFLSICVDLPNKHFPHPRLLWKDFVSEETVGVHATLAHFVPDSAQLLGHFKKCLHLHRKIALDTVPHPMTPSAFFDMLASIGFTGSYERLSVLLMDAKKGHIVPSVFAVLNAMHVEPPPRTLGFPVGDDEDSLVAMPRAVSSDGKGNPGKHTMTRRRYERIHEIARYRVEQKFRKVEEPRLASRDVQTVEVFPSYFSHGRVRRSAVCEWDERASGAERNQVAEKNLRARRRRNSEGDTYLPFGLSFLTHKREWFATLLIQSTWRKFYARHRGARSEHAALQAFMKAHTIAYNIICKHVAPRVRKRLHARSVICRAVKRWRLERLLLVRFAKRRAVLARWASLFVQYTSTQPPDSWVALIAAMGSETASDLRDFSRGSAFISPVGSALVPTLTVLVMKVPSREKSNCCR